ncbi:MAG: DNA mismatch repair endonuclease MutL, partial [Defluviitaleaceae bacterium]|nr:DNA mismatch repair endonuclease MutL [Defluviitaleaceae bacterium]
MKIIRLDRHLINKIAAGEVVERPLSVVKELTENAIDAGASQITVEIRDGGLSTIRVTDNGSGISPENLSLAFVRHATSKIADFDDLMRVETLGFRGEALSSIAAVSQVEMLTKVRDQVMGTRVEIHGGQLISSKEAGCADGTTVIVSNLFYNTPARRKFLKKPGAEAGHVAHCLERLALGNPALTLRYINNGHIVFQTSGNGDLKAAILNVYGREFAVKTVVVDAEADKAGDVSLLREPRRDKETPPVLSD